MRKRLTIALVLLATGVAAARQLPRLQPQATGTGAIVGQVVEAGSGAPVAHARVWLHQTRGERARGVYPRSEQLTTDGSGSFAIRDLPAGQFSLSVTADGYQPGAYGKRRSDGEEAWITLNDDQTVSNATIELFRGGTIGGVVTDDRGEPMKEVFVEIWQRTSTGQLKHRFGARTDATGAYRIIDVPAGDHFVVARVWHDTMRQPPPSAERSSCMIEPPPPAPGTPTSPVVVQKPKYAVGEWFTSLPRGIPHPAPDDRGQPRTIPTTIYPSVSELSRASVVNMLDGEERTGINLQLRPAAATTIQGRVVPLPGRRIGNSSEVRLRLPGAPLDLFEHRTWIQPDNTFRILGVVVGSYLLEVELQEAVSCDVISHNSEDILTEMSLEVPPAGLNDVVVPIAAGAKMTGRLRFDGKTSRPESIDTWLTPVLRSDRGDTRLGAWHDGGQILIDGLIPGDYVLGVSQDKTGWFIRSMTWNGFDLAVRPLAMDHDDVSGVEVTMTDRPSPVEGRIVDATGNVVGDATVIVFPFDRASWPTAHDQLAGFERQRSLDGTYRFEHLVPGNYFIAAVDERRMSDWPRTQFLEAIAKQASPVRIAPGELRTLNLTIKGR